MSTVSEFYLACRNGDFDAVQHLLPSMSDEQKNRIESNGSTALHAATYFGHHDIVKLLLENGCTTWIRNNYKNTPYDEAQDEEMRQLFHRPDRNNESKRFASSDDCFSIVIRDVRKNNDKTEEDDNIPKGWIDGYKHIGTPKEREATVQQIVHAQMMKYCLKKFQVSDTCKDVLKVFKRSVPTDHKEYYTAKSLFEKFRSQQNVDELVRLYTMETPFYNALQHNVDSFAIELYSYLSSLKERAFKDGKTYRGLTMDDNSIKAYRWAAKDKGRMIEIKTMTSTTLQEDVAIKFAEENAVENNNKHCVLCVLEFPAVCYTAIDLYNGEPITKYTHEKEILLLPGTLFEVRAVTNGPKNGWYTIQLENIPVPHKILMKALNELKTA